MGGASENPCPATQEKKPGGSRKASISMTPSRATIDANRQPAMHCCHQVSRKIVHNGAVHQKLMLADHRR